MKKNPLTSAKYLVCVDSREESRVGLRLACMKAAARGSAVSLLHVLPPADFQVVGAVADRMREERTQEARKLLDMLTAEAEATYGVKPGAILREGTVGDQILAAVLEDPEVSMLVISIAQQGAGRGTLSTWLAGQLGSKLLVPLLMVPGNLTDQQLQTLI